MSVLLALLKWAHVKKTLTIHNGGDMREYWFGILARTVSAVFNLALAQKFNGQLNSNQGCSRLLKTPRVDIEKRWIMTQLKNISGFKLIIYENSKLKILCEKMRDF